MAKKIYPNDPCPCGSGKKYKNCCGRVNTLKVSDFTRSDIQMEDFVAERLYEDLQFLNDTLNVFFGGKGQDYCKNHRQEIDVKFKEGKLWDLVERDDLEIYSTYISRLNSEDFYDARSVKNVYPYGGGAPKVQEDIISLSQKNRIEKRGHQVEFFHAYLMFNLNKRFDDYFYLPGEKWTEDRSYGVTARRGYDFLFAMTMYLEMQLGVHVFLNRLDLKEWKQTHGKDVVKYFEIEEYKIPDGFLYFLDSYRDVLLKIKSRYSIRNELRLYHDIKAFDDSKYSQMLNLLDGKNENKHTECDYIKYLRCLVSATCLNDNKSYNNARIAFPQCDVFKYFEGLKDIIKLFDEKFDSMEIDPCKQYDEETIKHMEEFGYDLSAYTYSKHDLYQDAVFFMADELNGIDMSVRSISLEYNDFPGINEAEIDKEGYAAFNPARKIFRRNEIQIRKLRLEIYQILNGRMFDLCGEKNNELIGRYPVFPWVSRGDEKTLHVKLFDPGRTYEDLFSEDIGLRQQSLGMENRLTEIPVNCIDEYLIPDIYYTWDKEQDLMKEVESQNVQLIETDARRQKQMDLNQNLIRNVSHSSANYLNPDKLAETGLELQNAVKDNPGLNELHSSGNSLLLQSAQETYMTRQLNSLVWRCSGDPNYLLTNICGGLLSEGGVGVLGPAGFALKSLLERILFREYDERGKHIRKKLQITPEKLESMRKDFSQDILSTKEPEDEIFKWWNQYVGKLSIKISDLWREIHINPEGDFYDLITEIFLEQMLNALSHGDMTKKIKIEFGQAEGKIKDEIKWGFVFCENVIGEKFPGGKRRGIETLNATLLLMNGEEKGLETGENDDTFFSKAWLKRKFFTPL